MARPQGFAANCRNNGGNVLTGDPNNPHRTAARSRSDSNYRMMMSAKHVGELLGVLSSDSVEPAKPGHRCRPLGGGAEGASGGYLNFGRLNCGGTPIRVLMTHCCAIDKILFVIQ